jgi:hypothetical protein
MQDKGQMVLRQIVGLSWPTQAGGNMFVVVAGPCGSLLYLPGNAILNDTWRELEAKPEFKVGASLAETAPARPTHKHCAEHVA